MAENQKQKQSLIDKNKQKKYIIEELKKELDKCKKNNDNEQYNF